MGLELFLSSSVRTHVLLVDPVSILHAHFLTLRSVAVARFYIPNFYYLHFHSFQPIRLSLANKRSKMKFTTTLLFLASLVASGTHALSIPRQANLQSFGGNLGAAATPIVDSGNEDRPFQVGGDTFVNLAAALQRSCDQQFNACANQANAGDAGFSTAECQAQKGELNLN